jgi:DNA-3-methyladenine glycosylase II
VEHLTAVDPVLAGIIQRVGPLEPQQEPDLWLALVDAIVGQQLSIRAADTILRRLDALAGGAERPTPERLLELPDDSLRAAGLSGAKTRYLRDLASRWLDGTLPHASIPAMDDEEVVEALTRVKGIGRWTAEMILIFSLGRPDVLPLDDLGIRIAAQAAYGLEDRPGRQELAAMGEPWAPDRSAASLYLWRSRRTG